MTAGQIQAAHNKNKLTAPFELALRVHPVARNFEYRKEVRFAAEYVRAKYGDKCKLRQALKNEHMRDWRFDYLFDDHMLAVELNGGTHSGGRHVRGAALHSEYQKLNAAQILGYRVLIFDSKLAQSLDCAELIVKLAEVGR